MSKTRKSFAKRFKVTARGKVLRRTPGHRHLLRNRSAKQKRLAANDRSVSKSMSRLVKRAVPNKF